MLMYVWFSLYAPKPAELFVEKQDTQLILAFATAAYIILSLVTAGFITGYESDIGCFQGWRCV